MYHPTRGGVRGGRDQFSWDDVKVDKHRENYLGHSLKAPVGRWQKGKDLHWYAREKSSLSADAEAAKEEIKKIKEEEEQSMREALGLAPKRAHRPQGNRLDKHELSELVKRGSTAEDAGAGHAEAAHVHGLGFSKAHRPHVESSSHEPTMKEDGPSEMPRAPMPNPTTRNSEEEESEDESSRKKRRRDEKKQEKRERREKRERHEKREKRERHEKREKRERRHSSDDKRKHRKDKERRRHDSDSD